MTKLKFLKLSYGLAILMFLISLFQIVVGPLTLKLIDIQIPIMKKSFLDVICAERYKLASNNYLISLICNKEY